MADSLRIASLGGFGRVTTNMYVYELIPNGDVLIVDCGIGFPTEEMFGVDLLIPDASYLEKKKDKIVGIVLTHGHEDHNGALPWIIPQLGNVPVYGSKLAIALAKDKLREFQVAAQTHEVASGKQIKLGSFSITFAHVTHSIPDAMCLYIQTPVGNVFHTGDFKFDWTPPDGKLTDVETISKAGIDGVDLLLSDCLGAEREGVTPSEMNLAEMFDREVANTEGKFIMTTLSSNISRIQQAINASLAHGRKISFVGRSIRDNVKITKRLGYLNFPDKEVIPMDKIMSYPPGKLSLIISGAQAQAGSSLERIALGEHDFVKIAPGDKIVFSTDYIPGNEIAIHNLIDTLTHAGADVSYKEVTSDLHVSGHGSSVEQALMIALTRPRNLLPIGGQLRHMKQYQLLAERMGYKKEQVLLPDGGETATLLPDKTARITEKVDIRDIMVDGLGIGDVGNIVLRDRKMLSEEGVVVVVLQVGKTSGRVLEDPEVISRGFVFAREHKGFLEKTSKILARRLREQGPKGDGWAAKEKLKELAVDFLEKYLFEETGRRPMVLPVVVEI